MNFLKTKKIFWISLGLFIVSFIFRLYTSNTIYQFEVSGDQSGFLLSSLKIFRLFAPDSIMDFFKTLAWIINFGWGYFQIVFSAIGISILSLFHIPICEWTVSIPYMLLGSYTVIIIFRFLSKKIDISLALLMACIIGFGPTFVSTSRVNLNWHLGACLFINSVIYIYYFLTQGFLKRNILTGSFFLALYLVTDSQFPGIVIVIGYMFGLFCLKKDKIKIKAMLKKIPLMAYLMPVITFGPILLAFIYFSLKGHTDYGFIGHNLEKKADWDFYGLTVLNEYIQNVGILLTCILPIGIIYGLYSTIKKKFISLFFVTAVVYIFPWLFMINRADTAGPSARCYLLIPTIALMILSCVGLFKIIKNKKVLSVILFCFFIEIVLVNLKIVHGFNIKNISYYNFCSTYGAADQHQRGLKTLGVWVRQNIEKDKTLFSNDEPPCARYLFHRKTFGIYDIDTKSQNEIESYFLEKKDNFDYVFLSEKWHENLKSITNDFYVNFIFLFKDKKYYMLSKEKIDIKQINLEDKHNVFFNEFDRKYGCISELKWLKVWETEG